MCPGSMPKRRAKSMNSSTKPQRAPDALRNGMFGGVSAIPTLRLRRAPASALFGHDHDDESGLVGAGFCAAEPADLRAHRRRADRRRMHVFSGDPGIRTVAA